MILTTERLLLREFKPGTGLANHVKAAILPPGSRVVDLLLTRRRCDRNRKVARQ